ncbi:MAG: hypothetical protein R3200_14625 [Xanthomonadales bacterium]|nr:hypothetical protein [Xanthomonadales bacterium]
MSSKRPIPLLLGLALTLAGGCTVYRTDGPEAREGADQVYICHKGKKTMRVADPAVRAHLDHGDRLGVCP